tara:strand:+ start:820 stop:1413 length:594 start_codon:yes stop_codon:yes gene_type:complete
MSYKKYLKFFFPILILLIMLFFIYDKKFKKTDNDLNIVDVQKEETLKEELQTNSNIIKDVKYVSKDAKGNEYLIQALEGEIDYTDPNVIYLKNVKALIKLKDSNNIVVSSKFGKYNLGNYDTIFSKSVVINYLDNKITGGYLDFSLDRNSMIISKKVVYNNLKNVLKADVVEINIETKDTKIFMYENSKSVNIKSKN